MHWDVDITSPEDTDLPSVPAEVYEYWKGLPRGDDVPAWADFKLTALSTEAVPFTIILDVQRAPLDFIYRFWGTANTTYIGYDCTGKSVSENKLFSRKVFDECAMIVEQRRPLVFYSKVTREGGLYREYKRLRAPLSDEAGEISQIVSAVHINENLWEAFGDDDG